MLKYMLDTNICIALIKGRGQVLQERFNQQAGSLCISVVTLFELQTGVEKSQQKARNQHVLDLLLQNVAVIELGEGAAYHSSQIRADLEREGKPIGPCDTFIAGHARSLGLSVVTNNTKEFSRVPGLLVEDWLQ